MKQSSAVQVAIVMLILLFWGNIARSKNVIPINDSIGLNAYLIERNDTTSLSYDSAYILNKHIYKLYKKTYDKALAGVNPWQELSRAYTDLIKQQNEVIRFKEQYYLNLKSDFDSLANYTNSFLTKADTSLTGIGQSINGAVSSIENIKLAINSSLEKLQLQRSKKRELLFGGFALGIGIASLTFLIVK